MGACRITALMRDSSQSGILTSNGSQSLRDINQNNQYYYEHDKYNIHLGHYNPAAGPSWHRLSCPTGPLGVASLAGMSDQMYGDLGPPQRDRAGD